MNSTETPDFVDKVKIGIQLAVSRLLEKAKKDNSEIVISKNGKVVKIKAREL
jgi:sulfur carrier protein ThiS